VLNLLFPSHDHPDTLCPDGRVWKAKHEAGEWGEWSNNPWQLDFHAAGAANQERMNECANRVGKCVTGDQEIEHPDGTKTKAKDLYEAGKEFDVLSWDGERLVPSVARFQIKKPSEKCYRFYLSSGDYFESSANHLVLTEEGYEFAGRSLSYAASLQASDSAICRLVRVLSARSYTKKLAGFLVGCLADYRLCDEQLHFSLGIDLAFSPSLNGVQQHSVASYNLDDQENKYNDNPSQSSRRLSSQDEDARLLGRCVGFLYRFCNNIAERLSGLRQVFQQLVPALIFRFQSSREPDQHQYLALHSPYECANRIVAYESIGAQEVYDFSVPEYSNYFASGVIHHNTHSAAPEVAFHMTGL